MEFKGTKGEWKLTPSKSGITINGKLMITCWAEDTNDLDERLSGESWLDMRLRTEIERERRTEFVPKANAQLIATAPKLLENAQQQFDSVELSNLDFFNKYGFNVSELHEKTKEVINQATKID